MTVLDSWTVTANGSTAGNYRLVLANGDLRLEMSAHNRWVEVEARDPVQRILLNRLGDASKGAAENRRRMVWLRSWWHYRWRSTTRPAAWPSRVVLLEDVTETGYRQYTEQRQPYVLAAGTQVTTEVDVAGRVYAIPPIGQAHPSWRPEVTAYWVEDWQEDRPELGSGGQ